MANIPPKKFYLMNKSDQYTYATSEMNKHYDLADFWKKTAQRANKKQIQEPKESDRLDEILLKDGI